MESKVSQQYITAVVLLLGALLKVFGVEFESGVLEGLIVGVLALWIAIRRFQKKDINLVGVRK